MALDDRRLRQSRSAVDRAAQGLDTALGRMSRFARGLARLSGALVALMAVLVGVEVALRGLTDISVTFTHELSGYALAIVFSLSLAYALLCKAHIRIDLLYIGAGARLKRAMDILSLLLLTAFSFMLVHASWGVFQLSYVRDSVANTGMGTPLWIPQSVWFAGFVVFALTAVLVLLRVVLAVCGAGPERAEQLMGSSPEA